MYTKPTLVIMAAGMGSRFGGLKQMTPVDDAGHFIIDYSLFDAWRAGFRRVVFIIKEELREAFHETVGRRMEPWFEVVYVYQKLTDLPEGFSVPENRVKPWGTGHAIAACRNVLDGPFAVINADDFYGAGAYRAVYEFLANNPDERQYAMVAYLLRNTVTEHGSVARGICSVENGLLTGITERTKIFRRGEDAAFTEDGETFEPLSGDTLVSMNLFGFTARFLQVLWDGFPAFLAENLPKNPEKCEYYLPSAVSGELAAGSASVRVLPCGEAWHGVTYREDLPAVVEAIRNLRTQGLYDGMDERI